MQSSFHITKVALVVVLAASCLGDPVGPGALTVATIGASPDTVWAGAPGEPIAGGVRLLVTDDAGRALPGASLTWEVFGQNAQVLTAAAQSNTGGYATAGWQLGTNAAEDQLLHILVRTPHHQQEITINARAVPYIVTQLRVALDTPAVLRLGDTVSFHTIAIDPYGNAFPAPDVAPSLFVGGPRRGRTVVEIASHGVTTAVPLEIVQYVAEIKPATDTIELRSIGAELPVGYVVQDDRGRVVADTLVSLAPADTGIAQVFGSRVRAVQPGITVVQLAIGAVQASVAVAVQQRIASLQFRRDTILFDALRDTTIIYPLAHDSLGARIPHPAVVLRTTNEGIVRASGRTLESVHPGVTAAVMQDSLTGVAATVPVVVEQRITAIDLGSVAFDALGDTASVQAVAYDRLGSAVIDAGLEYQVSDSSVVAIAGSGLRSLRDGRVTLTAWDPVSGTRQTSEVTVAQRVTSVELSAASLHFDALSDTAPVQFTAKDRLGAAAQYPRVTYSSSDAAVVSVDQNGRIESRGNGSAVIVASSADGAADSVAVTVEQGVVGITLDRDSILFESLNAEQRVQAIPFDRLGHTVASAQVTYVSGDPSVVAVDSTGTVVAKANGQATVFVVSGGDTARVALAVAQRITAIDLTSVSFDALGDTAMLRAVGHDRLGSAVQAELEYQVSDPGVVAVVGSRVRSLREGRAVLTASDPASGTSQTAEILVAQRVTSLELSAAALRFDALTDTMPIAYTAKDRLGAIAQSAHVTYASSDPTVVAVDQNGRTESRGNGSAVIVATSPDGPSASVAVTVEQSVAAVTLDRDSLLFESLNAELRVLGVPVDRLGHAVSRARVTYVADDPAVIAVDSLGDVVARANGTATLLAVSDGDTARATISVAQRPVKMVVPADTIRFSAFGETARLTGVAVDSLGSPVPGGDVAEAAVGDAAIVGLLDSTSVESRGNGITSATLTAAGVTGQVVIVVDQVATSLDVRVDFPSEVITLPAGAQLTLRCEAKDRNGFEINRDARLVESRKGTVTGTGCSDARVQRSGYDTLRFSMGTAEAHIAVIVATAPDSVGVISAAQPLPADDRIRFVGEDLANPRILALRPLVQDILAAYGNPTNSLDRARALRDWIARTAIHPHPAFHPDGSSSGLSVLPSGNTWADVNALPLNKFFDEDNVYWWAVGYDGYSMLDRLLGTLDTATGLRADDGMMVHVEGVRYRIRDVQAYHYTLCTFQVIMLNALWAAAGLQGLLISTLGHDPAAVFIPELGRWVYEDPTFNEEYLLDGTGDPLSPTDLLALSSGGAANRLHARKLPGPSFDPEIYIEGDSYLSEHPDGMLIMGSQLNSRVVGVTAPGGWPTLLVQIDVPRLALELPYGDPLAYVRVTDRTAFPVLGVIIDDIVAEDSVYAVRLSSTFPGHAQFQRRLNGGVWTSVTATDVLPVGACRVEYRSLDSLGHPSAVAALDVWLPRPAVFVGSGDPGSLRRQTELCTQ